MITCTVIGCGHGGQALAADLTQRGCKVSLYASPQHPGGLQAISDAGGITCKGTITGFTPIAKITSDLQDALKDSEYLFIALPSYAHESTFIELLPLLHADQTVVTLAANFASLIYLKLLTKTNAAKKINIIDMASLPYICRADNQGTVDIVTTKKSVAAASIPASAIYSHIQKLSSVFPCEIVPYQDVLSLGMNNTNGLAHPAVALLNAGRIGEGKESFYFYRDGITPEIATVIEKQDEERMLIGKKLGLEMYSFLELMEQYYGNRFDSIYEFFKNSPPHNALPMCPTSLQARCVSEDVAGTLVAWHSLGKLVGFKSVALNNLIKLGSLLNNTDYLSTGTNLKKMNLHDKKIDDVKRYIKTGTIPVSPSNVYTSYFGFEQPMPVTA